ncbi:pollen-specific leucine-rich repeat extensin-like protein 1 [Orussus abietinus]|uniref:pollen-specific leucine-rich repeat extensin-like protein 1 n=1 Tax=Orussus abietinus TaxID=222816 RepID=UPI00062687C3|nr:pollen-specific leucine-rich repeat extensin-like protein 1 [Orussus abietinus]
MREKSAECHARTGYVRGTTDMCSRDPPALHPALAKANGKNSSPQPNHHVEARIDNNVLPTPGGRLKFFKDGKFILELSHRRDGERTTWFPVPKKTFWPPASTTPNRQESSTSLSVSDDNSSVQSSPWQRDHCWKQANPRRNTSTEFNFYYRRNPRNRLCAHPRLVARKRRRPLDSTVPLFPLDSAACFARPSRKANGVPSGRTLSLIIDKLSRSDPNVVSPRKRILRELERVTLEDQASKRRATPQPTITTSAPTPSPKQLSSYSITSILGEDKPSPEPGFLRNLLKPEDRQPMKYSSNHPYPRARIDPYIASANTSVHHPLYGVPMLPPGPYRAPLWMHYPPPVHYPPMPLYAPPPPPPPSPPVHHYKDYREQTLTPPSDMPLNLSKHAG